MSASRKEGERERHALPRWVVAVISKFAGGGRSTRSDKRNPRESHPENISIVSRDEKENQLSAGDRGIWGAPKRHEQIFSLDAPA